VYELWLVSCLYVRVRLSCDGYEAGSLDGLLVRCYFFYHFNGLLKNISMVLK